MIRYFPAICAIGLSWFVITTADAQRIQSPQVHEDHTVTFRFPSSVPQKVKVRINRLANGTFEMNRGENNLWSVTTPAIEPGIHEYLFLVDGVPTLDRHNRWTKKWYTCENLFQVPGDTPTLVDVQSVPHGSLTRHTYDSKSTGRQRDLLVYIPPGYHRDSQTRYPVLVLMHGFGDDYSAWTDVGKAGVIADNLLAAGKIQPMLIVMPDGHPLPKPYGNRPSNYFDNNNRAMETTVVDEVIPLIDTIYRTKTAAKDRAIAGLSMGGGHT
ncbi:MAG: alpha/beta hydrolase-fold protein, partial [Planctomycetota bacterium]